MAETPTTVLPDYYFQIDADLGDEFNTLVKRTPTGREQRKQYYQDGGYRSWVINTAYLSMVDRSNLRTFMRSMQGKKNSFYIFDPFPMNFYTQNVGTVAGATSLIIPYKTIVGTVDDVPSLLTLTIGGVSTAFTVSEGIGTYGEARLNWSGAKTGACVLTFCGRSRHVGRFDMDRYAQKFMQGVANIYTSFNLKIMEL